MFENEEEEEEAEWGNSTEKALKGREDPDCHSAPPNGNHESRGAFLAPERVHGRGGTELRAATG